MCVPVGVGSAREIPIALRTSVELICMTLRDRVSYSKRALPHKICKLRNWLNLHVNRLSRGLASNCVTS